MKTIRQFCECLEEIPFPLLISLLIKLLIYAGINYLWRATMGKRVWPRIVLVIISIAYALFAINYFSTNPGIVFASGVVLGGFLIGIFIFGLLKGKPPED